MWTFKETQPKHRHGNKAYSDFMQIIYWILPLMAIAVGFTLGIDSLRITGVLVGGLFLLIFLGKHLIRLYVLLYRDKHEDDL